MIDSRDTPLKDIYEFEESESILEIFKPDFTVYVQEHCGMTDSNKTEHEIKSNKFETKNLE